MSLENPLLRLVRRYKRGEILGIPSICSANPYVIKATFRVAKSMDSELVLIEATSNQVNQFGGYSGLKPDDFTRLVYREAEELDFPADRILVGGDHFGPLPWSSKPAEEAMELSKQLIAEAVRASFRKLHIDTSFPLASDGKTVSPETVFTRTVDLIATAEEEFERHPDSDIPPVYVVGSDVPTPGGKLGESGVTEPERLREDIEIFRKLLSERGFQKVWERVVGIVINHGAEFLHDRVLPYAHEKVRKLKDLIDPHPNLVFEGHSTDYQPYSVLRQMVEDGIVILKVGPALTFALREALVALYHIEELLLGGETTREKSNFLETLKEAMLGDPSHWVKHYSPSDPDLHWKLIFSFYDRSRYYLYDKKVQKSASVLVRNLREKSVPPPLLSQYMPGQFSKVLEGRLTPDPEELILDKISERLLPYFSLMPQRTRHEQ